MFRKNGFATISFDSYEMNGLEDWEFVTRRVANDGKQTMIWGVFKGAVDILSRNRPFERLLFGELDTGIFTIPKEKIDLSKNALRANISKGIAVSLVLTLWSPSESSVSD